MGICSSGCVVRQVQVTTSMHYYCNIQLIFKYTIPVVCMHSILKRGKFYTLKNSFKSLCQSEAQFFAIRQMASAAPQGAGECAYLPNTLRKLTERFEHYFLCVAKIKVSDWIQDPFNQSIKIGVLLL